MLWKITFLEFGRMSESFVFGENTTIQEIVEIEY